MSTPTFSGSVPRAYHACLGPMLFDAYAKDLAARCAKLGPTRLLETACGTAVLRGWKPEIDATVVERLRLELLETAAGDDAHRRLAEESAHQVDHLVGQRALRRGERVVKVEHHQLVGLSVRRNRHAPPILVVCRTGNFLPIDRVYSVTRSAVTGQEPCCRASSSASGRSLYQLVKLIGRMKPRAWAMPSATSPRSLR